MTAIFIPFLGLRRFLALATGQSFAAHAALPHALRERDLVESVYRPPWRGCFTTFGFLSGSHAATLAA
jgi:hypothetical protein